MLLDADAIIRDLAQWRQKREEEMRERKRCAEEAVGGGGGGAKVLSGEADLK